jgi:hypothetical protein
MLGSVPVILFALTSIQGALAPNPDAARLANQLLRFKTWQEHRELIANFRSHDKLESLLYAYILDADHSPQPLLVAGLTSCYNSLESFWHAHLLKYPPDDRAEPIIRKYFQEAEAKRSAPFLYEYYIFLYVTPPDPIGMGTVLRYLDVRKPDGSFATNPDGTRMRIPAYDGTADAKRRKKEIEAVAALASKLPSQIVETEYMLAYEAPHDEMRYLKLADIVSKNVDIFGYPGLLAVCRAAESLGKTVAAAKWRSKADDRLAKEASQDRALYKYLYRE